MNALLLYPDRFFFFGSFATGRSIELGDFMMNSRVTLFFFLLIVCACAPFFFFNCYSAAAAAATPALTVRFRIWLMSCNLGS